MSSSIYTNCPHQFLNIQPHCQPHKVPHLGYQGSIATKPNQDINSDLGKRFYTQVVHPTDLTSLIHNWFADWNGTCCFLEERETKFTLQTGIIESEQKFENIQQENSPLEDGNSTAAGVRAKTGEKKWSTSWPLHNNWSCLLTCARASNILMQDSDHNINTD